MSDEKLLLRDLNKLSVKYMREVEGNLSTIITDNEDGTTKIRQFVRGKLFAVRRDYDNFDKTCIEFNWAFIKSPHMFLEMKGF